MEQQHKVKVLLPPPSFEKKPHELGRAKPHYLTPSGMTLLPREKQPPPMYGPRGATVPAKFLPETQRDGGKSKGYEEPKQKRVHYCAMCDMTFESGVDLNVHFSEHQRCPVTGCKFRGHKSLMDDHAVIHSSGLLDQVKKLNTPEEIAAWREERRKKYPTLANVEMRQRALEQRRKRGERLEENRSRFANRDDRQRMQNSMRNNTSQAERQDPQMEARNNNIKGNNTSQAERQDPQMEARNNNIKENNTSQAERQDPQMEARNNNIQRNDRKTRKRKRKQKFKQTEEPPKKQANVAVAEQEEKCAGVRMFRGTSALVDYKHIIRKSRAAETNPLAKMLAIYGSDDDDTDASDDEPEETEIESTSVVREEFKLNDVAIRTNIIPVVQTVDATDECVEPSVEETSHSHVEQCSDRIQNDSIADEVPDLKEDKCVSEASDEDPPDEAPIERISSLPLASKDLAGSSSVHQQGKSSAGGPKDARSRNVRQFQRKSGLDYRNLRKQNTMLEKLLEPDIRHERNVLLQCVRFVCENNFFGIGGKAATKNTPG